METHMPKEIIDLFDFQKRVLEKLQPIGIESETGGLRNEKVERKLQRCRAALKLARATGDLIGTVGDNEFCKPGSFSNSKAEEQFARVLFWTAAAAMLSGVSLNQALSRASKNLG